MKALIESEGELLKLFKTQALSGSDFDLLNSCQRSTHIPILFLYKHQAFISYDLLQRFPHLNYATCGDKAHIKSVNVLCDHEIWEYEWRLGRGERG